MLVVHRPGPPLSTLVETVWHYEGHHTSHHAERVLPNGRFQLVIDLAGGRSALIGLRSKSTLIRPAAIQCVIGVVFQPGGAWRFFREPASDFYNQAVPLDAVCGSSRFSRLTNRLRSALTVEDRLRILERSLLKMLQDSPHFALHPAVEHALMRFRHSPRMPSVVSVSSENTLSRRWFGHVFADQIGMTPKRYCRLARFRSIVRQIAAGGSIDWAGVALAGGYCDQAHLAHDFREFSGMTPTSYMAAERPHLNHVRLD